MAGGHSTAFDGDILKLILNGTPIANIADNAASSPLTNLQLAMHTADPGAGGDQTTNEIAYTGYARVAVARTSGAIAVVGSVGSLVAQADFPASTGGAATTATWFSLGVAGSGASKVLYRGPLTPTIAISTGTTPFIAAGTSFTEA